MASMPTFPTSKSSSPAMSIDNPPLELAGEVIKGPYSQPSASRIAVSTGE